MMNGQAATLTDADIANLSEYYASQKVFACKTLSIITYTCTLGRTKVKNIASVLVVLLLDAPENSTMPTPLAKVPSVCQRVLWKEKFCQLSSDA